MNAITANLKSLSMFTGRQRRTQFWPYVALVIGLNFLIAWVIIAIGISLLFAASRAPHEAAQTGPALALATLIMGMTALIALSSVLMLAAAVSRRLHDSGLRAHWGLLPLPFLAYGLVAMPIVFRGALRNIDQGGDFNVTLFMSIFFNNVIYMVALVTLIVLLCRPSTPGSNRYGEQPA